MNVTLDQLSPLLLQQHHDFCREDTKVSIQNLKVEIDNIEVAVIVYMEKEEYDLSRISPAFREKTIRKAAKIDIIPLNVKVGEAVIGHFKSQVRPNVWKKNQYVPIFDSFSINDNGTFVSKF